MNADDAPSPNAPAGDGGGAGSLGPEERAVVDDEVGMAARVGRRIAQSLATQQQQQQQQQQGPKRGKRVEMAELVALRDQIAEARNEDVPALVAAMIQAAGVASVEGPKASGGVDPATPYFGHLRLEESGRRRDVLIGKRGMIDREAGVVIVDWRDAPVSRLYYRYDEGDEYEEELGDVVREGVVVVRRTVTFVDGNLVRVRCPTGTFVKRNEHWQALAARVAPELKGGVGVAERAPPEGAPQRPRHAPLANTRGQLGLDFGDAHLRPDKHLPEIAALIDAKQFDAMTQPTSGLVILQGGAGSGKTTVALHRVAWLSFESPEDHRPAHMAVVVAQPQLVRYVERLLPALDVAGVRVFAYRDWVESAVERVVGAARTGKPAKRKKGTVLGKRVLDEVPHDVSRVKKHPAMLAAVRAQWSRRVDALNTALAALELDKVGADDAVAQARALRESGLTGKPRATQERARKLLDAFLERADDVVADWEELITDRSLLASTGVEGGTLDACLRYTKRQIDEVPDLSDVDDELKTPVDERGDIDPDDPLQAFDVHDLPLLLCMWIERHGSLAPIAHDHVVVDEAQDLSALELAPLVVSTGAKRSVTLAGDVVQKVVFDNGYDEWHELEAQLSPYMLGKRALDAHGRSVVETGGFAEGSTTRTPPASGQNVEPFRLSYRSTAEVVAFAREVLGPLAPAEAPRAVRNGAPVDVFSFADPGEEIAFLADNLRSLMAREPNASVALLCRYPERARFYAKMLQAAEVPRLRLVLGQSDAAADQWGADDFTFAPGVDVTHVSRVKGLEYDYVILAEVTEAMYPDQVAARHLLHIGATRAAHQLWLTTSTTSPSPLLPARLLTDE